MLRRTALVCLDLQNEYVTGSPPNRIAQPERVISAARSVLEQARASRWLIVHCQLKTKGGPFDQRSSLSGPIDDLKPRSNEYLFERSAFSAYTSRDFSRFMEERYDAPTYLIGFAAPYAVLATLFDAFANGHDITPIADAVSSPPIGSYSGEEATEFAVEIASLLGRVGAMKPGAPAARPVAHNSAIRIA